MALALILVFRPAYALLAGTGRRLGRLSQGKFRTKPRGCPPLPADTAGIGRSGVTWFLARSVLRSPPGQINGTLPMTSERRRHRDPAPGTRAMDIPRGSRGQG